MSCIVCKSKVSRDVLKLKCSQCSLMVHASCVNLSHSDIDLFHKEKKLWNCEICAVKNNKGGSSCSVPVLTSDVCDFNDIPGSFKYICDKLSYYSATFNSRFDDVISIFDSLKQENAMLKSKIVQLESAVDNLEQRAKNKSVEIVGLPVLQNNHEVLKTTLELFSTGLNVAVNETDIESIYQVKSSDVRKTGKVIVEFVNSSTRNTVLQSKRKKKNLSTECLNLNDNKNILIFINECMTKFKYTIFKKAKEIKKSKHYKYLWSRNGRIMLRKCEGDKVKIINNLSDLDVL